MFWLVTDLKSLAFLHRSERAKLTREKRGDTITDSMSVSGSQILKPSATDAN